MNIGFDAKRYFHNFTGLGNYSRQTIEYLNTYHPGLNLSLYTPKLNVNSQKATPKAVNTRLPRSRLASTLNMWRGRCIVADLVEDKIEIYHGLSNEIPVGLKDKQICSVVTIHDLIFLIYPRTYPLIDRLVYNYKFRHACRNADVIVATSENTKKDIIRFYGTEESKIKVVYQCIDPIFYESVDNKIKESVKQKFGLPDHYILNVGTIEERKNIGTVIQAIKDLDQCHLVIVGKLAGAYGNKVLRLIQELELQDRVHLLQNLTSKLELVAIYQQSDFVVFPSLYEGFGIPLVEAMASKKAIVASDASCFREIAGASAHYCSPEDVGAFRDAIENLYLDGVLRSQLEMAGVLQLAKFNPETMAKQLFKIYCDLVSR
jgi:glycosyltransferase involved in cell wall biosynthesis